MSATRTMARPPTARSCDALDVAQIRGHFPALHQTVHGRPLAYLDNAATTQKPQCVLDALEHYYRFDNANIHRGVHDLSVRATRAYEQARATVGRFLGAARPEEIVFVRGATESINLVAQSFLRPRLQGGDEILISHLEHHANIVPWQILGEQTGATLRVIPTDERGELVLDEYDRLLGPRTRLVAVTHVSNALGTIVPVHDIVTRARAHGVPVLLDGAQAVPHLSVDVRDLGCDFYVFSGHKVYAPTGIGALYGRFEHLERMPPYQGGGDMIKSVTFAETIYNDPPYRFEAGTPHIAGAIGLAAALDYVQRLGLERIAACEHELLEYATQRVGGISGVRLIGTARQKAAILGFVVSGLHAHDVGTVLDHEGVAVRTGHHCAQPILERFGVPATVRASLAFYNTPGEIDALVAGVHKAIEVLG